MSQAAATMDRRTVIRGALAVGAGAGALTLAACTDDEGTQEPDAADVAALKVVYSEDPASRGDWTVWTVGYDLADGQEAPDVFDAATQAARHEALEAKKAERTWTASDPLLVLDPYGTTRTGLYVHFEDESAGSLDVVSRAAATEDYAITPANHAADGGFEGLLIALVPGAHNTLTLTWTPEGDGADDQAGDPAAGTVTGELVIKAVTTSSGYGTSLAAEIVDADALTPGLFALSGLSGLGNSTYLFDRTGTMRAEFQAGDSAAHRFQVVDGQLVLATGSRRISVIDHLGRATTTIDTGRQSIHHDLVVVDGIAYALTSDLDADEVEDRVIRVDLATGEVDEVVDMKQLLPEYEALTRLDEGEAGGTEATGKDWIHLNTVDVVDGIMYLSSRETSTIIALDDALDVGGTPSVRWMIGPTALWEGTGYEDLLLAADGVEIGNAGQHTVRRIDDDSLPEGQHYLEMFNNNYWFLDTRDDGDWEDAGPDGASTLEHDGVSHILRYLVDETAGTFTQDLAVEVPYSSVVSSVFRLGDGGITSPLVVNSGRANVFSERTADGEVLATYRYDSAGFGYRVYKDAFAGFWFA